MVTVPSTTKAQVGDRSAFHGKNCKLPSVIVYG